MKKLFLLGLFILIVVAPRKVDAVMQTLNGLGGQNQTFVNDTNFTISSNGTAHTLGWNGLLSAARGGAGVDLSSFRTGSLLFWDGSKIAETLDSDYLSWNETNQMLNAHSIKIDGGFEITNGAQINFYTDDWITQTGTFDAPSVGRYRFDGSGNGNGNGELDFTNLDSFISKVFTFPNASGTFSLLEIKNIFSNPVNKFISSSDSTVHIGADGIPGCLVVGDSDSNGVTYVTANNGVLNASAIKPSNCNN